MKLSVERAEGDPVDAVSVIARVAPDAAVLGYSQAVSRPGGWSVEVVLDSRSEDVPSVPDVPGSEEVRGALLGAALEAIAGHGSPSVTLWEDQPAAEHDRVAARAGLTHRRDLFQMRRPLPVDATWSIEVRPFEPGADDDNWLEVNHRAFAKHPEQGAWDRATLERTLAEPWFDPSGFLLHEIEGRLAGFCWTKVHPDEHPPLGEIFVIAVDPDYSGRGLGRELTLAGLDHLCRQGLTVGMLYVDADNKPALRMYEKMGFVVDHIRRGYSRPTS